MALSRKERKKIWNKHAGTGNPMLLGEENLLFSIKFNLSDVDKKEFDAAAKNEIDKLTKGGNDA